MIQLPAQLAAQGCRDMGLGVSGRDAQVPPPGLQAVEHVFCRSCQPLQSNARLRLLLWSTNRRLLFPPISLLSESYLGSRRDIRQGHAHHATCHVADLMQELVRSAIVRCWNCGVSLVLRLARGFRDTSQVTRGVPNRDRHSCDQGESPRSCYLFICALQNAGVSILVWGMHRLLRRLYRLTDWSKHGEAQVVIFITTLVSCTASAQGGHETRQ